MYLFRFLRKRNKTTRIKQVRGTMLVWLFLVCLVSLWDAVITDQEYIEYIPGHSDSRIILSAPHGGSLKPDDLPTRDFGCYVDEKCVWSHDCGTKDEKKCAAKVKQVKMQRMTL